MAFHGELVTALDVFVSNANSNLAALLQAELGETVAQYQLLKERNGKLDFLDLLIRARDLLVQSPSVRKHFQERFTHLFVDEFQDTDPLQAEIIVLLSASDRDANNWRSVTPVPGKLFIVGDPKQAIYRFRRADVGTYEEVKQLLLRSGAELLQLTTSFRSLPSIQAMINRAFAPYMDGNAKNLQAGYVPLSPFREEDRQQPSIVALPVPRPYKKKFSMEAVEESLPDAIAAFVAWLVEDSGWTVPQPGHPGERYPSGPIMSACFSGGSPVATMTWRVPTSGRSKQGISRTCWLVENPSMIARKCKRFVQRSPRSNGRMTSSRSLQP